MGSNRARSALVAVAIRFEIPWYDETVAEGKGFCHRFHVKYFGGAQAGFDWVWRALVGKVEPEDNAGLRGVLVDGGVG